MPKQEKRTKKSHHGELNNQFWEDQMDFGDNKHGENQNYNENIRYGDLGRTRERAGYSSADEYGENIGNDLISDQPIRRSRESIKQEALETLYRISEVDASSIDVEVMEGCLFLSGTVNSREEKKAAERSVENIQGVEDVQNNLKLKRSRFPIGKEKIH